MIAYVLHTRAQVGVLTKVFGVAVGEHGFERLNAEMANYSQAAQGIMTITAHETLE